MSIKYTYLPPNSPFTAEAVNSRFSDAEAGINALALEDLNVGALHADHMPSPIGQNGVAPSAQRYSTESSNAFDSSARYDEGSDVWYNPGQYLTAPSLAFTPAISLGMTESQRVSAVILMANITINKMSSETSEIVSIVGNNALYEDRDGLGFAFRITDSEGEAAILLGSQRATSPGATIKRSDARPHSNDRNCDRDVPMRYVVTPKILEDNNLIDIARVDIAFQRAPFHSNGLIGMSFTIGKHNMTVLPIHSTTDVSYA